MTEPLNEQALQAAQDEFINSNFSLAAAITAYLAAAPRQVRVKPLVWSEGTYTTTDDDGGAMEGFPRELSAWRARNYLIIRQAGDDGRFILRGKSDGIGLVVPNLDQAKAAAQADHEACIRSTLELEPAAGWRSMDSAPRDGTRIIVKCVTFGWSSEICQRVATGDKAVEARWIKGLGGRETWWEWCGNDETHSTDGELVALGWMPLPAAPADAQEGGR